ncbi:hypothetical protein [Endozoicomonas sp. ONNA2]|uniref:hypothetical protein n=1 Tax=Endozoicomonas sp. ONNA2 TaxID=2828741 RepID=UPI00214824A2|nr:hypothetical protein [Endozoicomonas sp. ONNA2]
MEIFARGCAFWNSTKSFLSLPILVDATAAERKSSTIFTVGATVGATSISLDSVALLIAGVIFSAVGVLLSVVGAMPSTAASVASTVELILPAVGVTFFEDAIV